jgi:hypothetical protein
VLFPLFSFIGLEQKAILSIYCEFDLPIISEHLEKFSCLRKQGNVGSVGCALQES